MHQLTTLIDMKILKILTIISFLIIVFPGKIYFLNLLLMPLVFLSFIFSIGTDPISLITIGLFLRSTSAMLSVIYIFKKSRIITFGCLLIQYIWLVNCYNARDFVNVYYISTMTLYLLLSLILIVALLKKSKQIQNGDV